MTLRVLRLCARLGLMPLLLLAAAPGPGAGAAVLDPAAVSIHTLPNGLRVVVKEAPAISLVALNVWVRAGSADETEENNGVSHFLEHVMFKGTKKRGPGEFDREIEGLGGIANAVTMEDATQYFVVVAKQYAGQALEALGDVMSNPTFPEAAVRDEQRIILAELGQAAQNPEQVLADWLGRMSFRKHSYRLPTAGTPESVKRMTRAKILDFYQKYYTAANMSLVVVGAVKAQEILPQIEAAFGRLRQGEAPGRSAQPEPAPEKAQHSTLQGPMERGRLMIGFRSPGMGEKDDVCAMDVLLYTLGEKRAQSGRLNRELRQKRQLVSGIWSDYVTLRDPGLVTFYAEAEPPKLEQARDAILEQIAQMRDTLVPADEIQRAKQLLLGVYTLDNETYDGQAGTLGFYEAKDTYQFALEYADRIAKVTPADVQRVAQKYLGPNAYSLVMMRPKPKAAPPGASAQGGEAPAPSLEAGEAPAAPADAGDPPAPPLKAGEPPAPPPKEGEAPGAPPKAGETPAAPPKADEPPAAPPKADEPPAAPPETDEAQVVPPKAGETPLVPPKEGEVPAAPPEAGEAPGTPGRGEDPTAAPGQGEDPAAPPSPAGEAPGASGQEGEPPAAPAREDDPAAAPGKEDDPTVAPTQEEDPAAGPNPAGDDEASEEGE